MESSVNSQHLTIQRSRTLASRERESSVERSHRLAHENARSTNNRIRRQYNILNLCLWFDYSVLNNVDIGRMDKICSKCQAKK